MKLAKVAPPPPPPQPPPQPPPPPPPLLTPPLACSRADFQQKQQLWLELNLCPDRYKCLFD